MTAKQNAAYHADRDLDGWKDDCLYAHIFGPDGTMVAAVIVGTRDGTSSAGTETTADEDRAAGESRLAKILDALNA